MVNLVPLRFCRSENDPAVEDIVLSADRQFTQNHADHTDLRYGRPAGTA